MLPARLLDWFHILRSVHEKEQWKLSGFELPKLGEVLPHLKIKEAKMPFPSGRNLEQREVYIHSWHPSHSKISLLPAHFKFLLLFMSGSDKTDCREPIHSVFNYVLDQNADGILDEAELADIYEIGTEPCIKSFFKDCAKGRETFTEADFCSCFTTAGEGELFMF